jgi:hypothetical protein
VSRGVVVNYPPLLCYWLSHSAVLSLTRTQYNQVKDTNHRLLILGIGIRGAESGAYFECGLNVTSASNKWTAGPCQVLASTREEERGGYEIGLDDPYSLHVCQMLASVREEGRGGWDIVSEVSACVLGVSFERSGG